ncbi:Nif3-like dinuclear metal center hexameric protein [Aureibacter tunicatorum]|uniref:GTP cyclohydrolase 1 type 2 homolog n=1 Tax=Aureibacter tunicatorum TaxID=866807 RepID=A0AAE3XM87_9BACT|nr:Nif3-like dinuclear metal center hexameric protein [Aureibacter tunicatorum]MDR6239075.1 dinuclear metal center YbgI/SA1388 family protein [Aureibacter tunicatorum]BDD04999.1 GTP cyclohydrolase 1 type 2 [Aureibacter tunicatorum]
MPKIKEVIQFLENIAPLSYQESYDNSGLIVGNQNTEITGILVTLDTTEEVIKEAIEKNCNLIVSHHPIIFKGLKKINGKNYVERTVIDAIKNDIAIYAIHTNLDNVSEGVNKKLADKIGLSNVRTLSPKTGLLKKLEVFCPPEKMADIKNALHKAGAGEIGNYEQASFISNGTGTFLPKAEANPYSGEKGELSNVEEKKLELIFPAYLEGRILSAMQSAHPYEEVAYFVHDLGNSFQTVGSGMIGELTEALSPIEFLTLLKKNLNLEALRYTETHKKQIKRVAICGGAGSFLLRNALHQSADAFVTGDFKYHEFFDAEQKLIIADIGHYESEVYTKELICGFLSKKFISFTVYHSEINTNPVRYI